MYNYYYWTILIIFLTKNYKYRWNSFVCGTAVRMGVTITIIYTYARMSISVKIILRIRTTGTLLYLYIIILYILGRNRLRNGSLLLVPSIPFHRFFHMSNIRYTLYLQNNLFHITVTLSSTWLSVLKLIDGV